MADKSISQLSTITTANADDLLLISLKKDDLYFSYQIEKQNLYKADDFANNFLSNSTTLTDINDNEISDYTKKDYVDGNFLSSNVKLSAINDDEISNYAKKTELPTADDFANNFLSSNTTLTDINDNEISDYAKKTELPTADTFENNFLSSNVKLSAINSNEISNYAKSTDMNHVLELLDGFKLSTIIGTDADGNEHTYEILMKEKTTQLT